MSSEGADQFLRNVRDLTITRSRGDRGYIFRASGETVSLRQATNCEFRTVGAIRITHLYVGAEGSPAELDFNVNFNEDCDIRLQKGVRCYLHITPSEGRR